MNKSLYWATSLAVLTALNLVPAKAAAQGPGNSPVAVIDLVRVFENHIRYKQQMDEIQVELKRAEAELNRMRAEGQKLFEELEDTKRGSEKYKELDEEIAKREADFKIQVGIQKRNFAEREAKVMYAAYDEVQRRIAEYAYNNGFVLVVQFNSMALDINEPSTIQRAFSNFVQYHDRSIDITDAILRLCNNDGPPRTRPNNGISNGGRPPIPGKRSVVPGAPQRTGQKPDDPQRR